MSRLDRDNIKVEIDDIWPNHNHTGFGVNWHGSAGFGQWYIFFDESGTPYIDTEGMDDNSDKRFSKAILTKLVDKILNESDIMD